MGGTPQNHLVGWLPIDQAITYEDVELPTGRFCDQLREEPVDHFNP
jgi:predicted homoserine dehydrogenase-like protein